MSIDDFDDKDIAEKIANIVMEKLSKRDEALIARLKSEFKPEIRTDLMDDIRVELDKRDKALEARDLALHQMIDARYLALHQMLDTRDHELRLALEKGGIDVWKIVKQWAAGIVATK